MTVYPVPSSLDKKVNADSVCIYVQRLFFLTYFFFLKHVSVPTSELAVDCSPVKSLTTGKADKIVSIDSSPEPAKAKYLGYAGYGSVIAKARAGSGKSAMTKNY